VPGADGKLRDAWLQVDYGTFQNGMARSSRRGQSPGLTESGRYLIVHADPAKVGRVETNLRLPEPLRKVDSTGSIWLVQASHPTQPSLLRSSSSDHHTGAGGMVILAELALNAYLFFGPFVTQLEVGKSLRPATRPTPTPWLFCPVKFPPSRRSSTGNAGAR
jgi:hypothetical protein